jgi:hypothetical protein
MILKRKKITKHLPKEIIFEIDNTADEWTAEYHDFKDWLDGEYDKEVEDEFRETEAFELH